uniref:Uncharacterized protein n=1 Tax=Trichobilharzia regenti TaxID=157069 RepID=A0AA85K1B8_TRIRE|nr:unnamed protein product [Trichobilharzia regenti]
MLDLHKGSFQNLCTLSMSSYISEASSAVFGYGNIKQQHVNDLYGSNNELLESLLQRIHTLESERHILKLRLEAVENDYDAQVKELQTDIIAMRADLKRERKMCKQIEKEKNTTISDLIQQNQSLTQRLNCSSENETQLQEELSSLRSEFLKHKSSMQEHVQSIESLRQEITKLREEKSHLESQLSAVVEERNNLLESLGESYQEINMLRNVASEQVATINNQDAEITMLQETANMLHNRLQILSSQKGSQDDKTNQSSNTKSTDTRPHRSLMAELAEQKMVQMENFGGLLSALEDGDDVEFEMDDDSFLAYLSCFDQDAVVDNALPSNSSAIPPKSEVNTKETFLNALRSEVKEIYQQMNQMCADVYALTGAKQQEYTKVGTQTPDELAMVEMDFRLGSLRSVLSDLRGLLKDLRIEIPEQTVLSSLSKEKQETGEGETKTNQTQPNCMSTPLNVDDQPVTSYEMECQIVRSERDALAAELLNAQQELLQLKHQIETGSSNAGDTHDHPSTKGNNFVAKWEEFEEEKYEFEMPH